MSPECVTADCQSSYCQKSMIVWRTMLGQVLDLVAEETFQSLPQKFPQGPGHQPQFLSVACLGLSNLASQSHHWASCGRKPTEHSSTKETCRSQSQQSNLHFHCSTHAHSYPMRGRAFWARIGLTSIFGPMVASV